MILGDDQMEDNTGYFDTWLVSQEIVIENLRKLTEQKHSEDFSRTEREQSEDPTDNNHRYTCLEQMLEKAKKNSAENHKVITESLLKSCNGKLVYSKLYDLWKPFLTSAQECVHQGNSKIGFANLAEYKKILDRVFGFPSAHIDDSFDQLVKLVDSFFPGQEAFKSWVDLGKNYANMFPQFTGNNTASDLEFLHTMMSVYTDTFGKIFPFGSVDITQEKASSSLQGLELLTRYLLATARYQHLIYVTGQTAIDTIVTEIFETLKQGDDPGDFDTFFDHWIAKNEATFQTLFQTEEFSEIQHHMMKSYLEFKNHMSKQVELYLADYPIPVRSEMNDLYRTIYELKKRLKFLEKKINGTGK